MSVQKTFDFVGKRKIWYAIAIVLILAGIVSFCIQQLNWGIDFTGGNLINIRFENGDVTLPQLQALTDKELSQTAAIQNGGDGNFIIRTEELSEEESAALLDAIEAEFGSFDTLQNEKIGPTIGKELINNAVKALIIAPILMLIYIAIRFEFKFAISAIIPIVHDVLITIGVFSILQLEVNSAFVAAILTIIGYSINNTIVVFDRVRENMRHGGRRDFPDLVNESITQTLGRSINTVIAVLIMVVALTIFGGETIRVFCIALIIGLLAGTFSSIFIAGSMLVDMKANKTKRKALLGSKR